LDEEEADDINKIEEEGSDSPNEEQNIRRGRRRKDAREHVSTNLFTIKDVGNSIPHFSGDDKLSIEKRLNFEDLNFLLQWNKLQKIGKRFLKGSAKRLVTYKRGIQS